MNPSLSERSIVQPLREGARPSYERILKSSALVGGSSAVNILVGILRSKSVAVFLGPTGSGTIGLFNSITSIVGSFAGMGIATSSIRKIAQEVTSSDKLRVARTAASSRQMLLWSGILWTVLLAALSVPISRLTFGTTNHAFDIALLSLVIVIGAVAEGRNALIQGFRRMGDVARLSVVGGVATVVFTLPVLYFWREKGIVATLLVGSGIGLLSSWWYSRQISVPPIGLTRREVLLEGRTLVGLGLASMSAGLMAAIVGYANRLIVVHHLSLGAAGLYQSAIALSTVYCGFILSAMGTDFLPRLSAAGENNTECTHLINEQAEVGLLLAFPGICATLTFAPFIIQVLYSTSFGPAGEVLRWQVLGVFLRVAAWPLSYLLLARSESKMFFWTELFYNLVHIGLVWIGVRLWGLPGAGVGFFGLYIVNLLMMTVVTRRYFAFTWSPTNKRFALMAIGTVTFVFLCPVLLPSPLDSLLGGVTTLLAGWYSFRTLVSLAGGRDRILELLPWHRQNT